MSSINIENLTAEQRFKQAFERLKTNKPNVVERNTPVTQNNVAREAGCDPSALRKSRFPALIREIQAYLELDQGSLQSKSATNLEQRKAKRAITEQLEDAIKQRDAAQSLLASANRRLVELSEQVQSLQQRLDEAQPKPIRIGL